MLIAGKRFHRIASGDSSLLKDGKVEASPTAAQESLHDFRAAKPNAELEARHSWLADNKLCRPNPEAITNVNSILSIGPFPIILPPLIIRMESVAQ
jgi:hypothetical protein